MNFLVWGIHDLFHNGLLYTLLNAIHPDEIGEALLYGGTYVLCIVVAYLLGSINWAIVISHVFFRDDIRKYGSGNAGATNMLRTYGAKAAIPTLLLDGFKGVFAILFACLIFGHPYTFVTVTAAYMAAFFAILGHVFPCFYRFKGGKGVSCTALVILALNPCLFLILFVIFAVLVGGTKYVSLGSIVAVGLYPILLSSFDTAFTHYGTPPLFALLIGALVIWAHRSNIKRIMDRTESKISFGKKKTPKSEPEEPSDTEE